MIIITLDKLRKNARNVKDSKYLNFCPFPFQSKEQRLFFLLVMFESFRSQIFPMLLKFIVDPFNSS